MQYRTSLAATALAMLAACGAPYTTVHVPGDSLNDGFGVKVPQCSRLDPHAACTLQGVTRDVPGGALGGDPSPFSIRQQLKHLATAGHEPDGLLLIDGGGHDVADLLRYFLMFSLELQPLAPADTRLYQLLAERGIVPDAPDEPHLAEAGGRYMQALADQLVDDLATWAIDKGARRVVVLDIPQLTKTPYPNAVQAQLARINADEAGRVMSMVDEWIRVFNLRLQVRFASGSRIAVEDPVRLGPWVDRPAHLDSTRMACPPEAGKLDHLGLSLHLRCQAAPSASRPGDPDGQGTLLADDFGSPMNRLMADLVLHKLRERGWL